MIYWYTEVLKKYAVFEGRSRRKEFWYFGLVNLIVSLLIQISNLKLPAPIPEPVWLYYFVVFIPSIAVSVRRLHDIGRCGWWCLLYFIPILGLFIMAVISSFDSDPGTNKYGPNPKLPKI